MFLTYGDDDSVRNQNPLVLGTNYNTIENLVSLDTLSAPDLSRTLMNVYANQTENYIASTALVDQLFSSSGVFDLQTSGVSPMNFTFTSGVSTTVGVDFMERSVGSTVHYLRVSPGIARLPFTGSGSGRTIVNVPRIKLAERQLARALSLYVLDGTEFVKITYNWQTQKYFLSATKLNPDGITTTSIVLNNGGPGYPTMVDMLIALIGSSLGASLTLTNNRLDIIQLEPTFYIGSAGTYYLKINASGAFICDTSSPIAGEMGLYSFVITSGTPWACTPTDTRILYSPGTLYASTLAQLATTSASVYNTNVLNLSIGGAATTIGIGASTGTLTLNNATFTLPNAANVNFNAANPILASTNTGTLTLFNTALLTVNAFGAATTMTLGAITGTASIRNITITLPNATTLNMNGVSPTLASTSTGTLTLFNTAITAVNAFGASTATAIGAATGTLTLNNPTIVGSATLTLFNTISTNVSVFGAATVLGIGAATGTLTLNNATLTLPNATVINVNAASPSFVSTSTGTLTFFNTNLLTVNAFGAANSVAIGAATGVMTLNNATLTLPNAANVNFNAANPTLASTNAGTLTLFNANLTAVNAFGAAATIVIGAATGTTSIRNATITLTNATTLNINGASPILTSTDTGTLSLFNTNLLTVNAFGAATSLSIGGTPTGAATFNIAANATANGITKTINIGTGGVSGSITNVNIGSNTGGAVGTVNIYGNLKAGNALIVTGSGVSINANQFGTIFMLSGNGTTATLPAISAVVVGYDFYVKNISTANIFVAASGADVIDGVSSITLLPYESIVVISNGTSWSII